MLALPDEMEANANSDPLVEGSRACERRFSSHSCRTLVGGTALRPFQLMVVWDKNCPFRSVEPSYGVPSIVLDKGKLG